MACIIERVDKKSGAIYLYESVCYWDRETSRPKTRQTYIGKKDRITGEIVPPRRKLANKAKQNPQKNFENHLDTTEQVIQTKELIDLPMIKDDGAFCTTRIIGPYLLLELISKQLGIKSYLKSAFGDKASEILSLAYFITQKGQPMYRCTSWSEKNKHPYDDIITNQRISSLFKEINSNEIEKFNYLWLKNIIEKDYLCYDITSISSYLENIEYTRYGYNRDGEKLPQINLAVLFVQTSGLPAYYKRLPGNITDAATLENIIKNLDYLGITNVNFVLDRDFYSIKNISEMLHKRHHFTFALPIDRT